MVICNLDFRNIFVKRSVEDGVIV